MAASVQFRWITRCLSRVNFARYDTIAQTVRQFKQSFPEPFPNFKRHHFICFQIVEFLLERALFWLLWAPHVQNSEHVPVVSFNFFAKLDNIIRKMSILSVVAFPAVTANNVENWISLLQTKKINKTCSTITGRSKLSWTWRCDTS